MDKILGGLYGVAVGDALGATLEFMSRAEIKRQHGQLREIIGGGWLGLKAGEWTDDTEMTLAVAEGILENPVDPIPYIGNRFLKWFESNPPDVGNTIRAAFREYLKEKEWHKAARAVHHKLGKTAGNGALMRTLPVALLYKDPTDIYNKSMQIARMTHWDPEAGLTCCLYCQLARELLNNEADKNIAWEKAVCSFLRVVEEECADTAKTLINEKLNIFDWSEERLNPSGYTVDSLACALWCLYNRDSFEESVITAVNLGGDADTVGAILGGLAGVYWGVEGIPKRWINRFSKEQVERLERQPILYRIMEM